MNIVSDDLLDADSGSEASSGSSGFGGRRSSMRQAHESLSGSQAKMRGLMFPILVSEGLQRHAVGLLPTAADIFNVASTMPGCVLSAHNSKLPDRRQQSTKGAESAESIYQRSARYTFDSDVTGAATREASRLAAKLGSSTTRISDGGSKLGDSILGWAMNNQNVQRAELPETDRVLYVYVNGLVDCAARNRNARRSGGGPADKQLQQRPRAWAIHVLGQVICWLQLLCHVFDQVRISAVRCALAVSTRVVQLLSCAPGLLL